MDTLFLGRLSAQILLMLSVVQMNNKFAAHSLCEWVITFKSSVSKHLLYLFLLLPAKTLLMLSYKTSTSGIYLMFDYCSMSSIGFPKSEKFRNIFLAAWLSVSFVLWTVLLQIQSLPNSIVPCLWKTTLTRFSARWKPHALALVILVPNIIVFQFLPIEKNLLYVINLY